MKKLVLALLALGVIGASANAQFQTTDTLSAADIQLLADYYGLDPAYVASLDLSADVTVAFYEIGSGNGWP